MKRLESAVRAVMQLQGIDQLSAAAARCGLTISQLSKILRGDIGLSPDNLRKLVTGLSPDPAHQFQILASHLYDEAERSGFDLSHLTISYAGGAESGITFSDLPTSLQTELRTIGDRVKDGDDDLGGAISWFARAITPRSVPRIDPDFPNIDIDAPRMAAEDGPSGLSIADQVVAAEQAMRQKKPSAPYPKTSKR